MRARRRLGAPATTASRSRCGAGRRRDPPRPRPLHGRRRPGHPAAGRHPPRPALHDASTARSSSRAMEPRRAHLGQQRRRRDRAAHRHLPVRRRGQPPAAAGAARRCSSCARTSGTARSIPLLADEIVKDDPGPGGRARPAARPAADRRPARLVRAARRRRARLVPRRTATRSSATRCGCMHHNPAHPWTVAELAARDRRVTRGARPPLPRAGRRAADGLPHELADRARGRPAARARRHDRLGRRTRSATAARSRSAPPSNACAASARSSTAAWRKRREARDRLSSITGMANPLVLSVLDQSPVPEGSTGADALRNTLDLARLADELGYHRYWVAEHHGGPLLAGPSPEVLIGPIAAATSRHARRQRRRDAPALQPAEGRRELQRAGRAVPGDASTSPSAARPGTDPHDDVRAAARPPPGRARRLPRRSSPSCWRCSRTASRPTTRSRGSPTLPGLPERPSRGCWAPRRRARSGRPQLGLPYAFADFINPDGAADRRALPRGLRGLRAALPAPARGRRRRGRSARRPTRRRSGSPPARG